METYSLLREFADSWVLLMMFAFFTSVGVWAFWPSQKANRDDAAQIPFRDEVPACTGNCTSCACITDFPKEPKNG